MYKSKPDVNSVKQTRNSRNENDFWKKADRIAIMTAGGAALGSSVFMVPGAIVGGILAGAYGYYIGFANKKSV
jgi:hypothetical protein